MTYDAVTRFVKRHRTAAFAYIPPESSSTAMGQGHLYIICYLEESQAIDAGVEKGIVCYKISGQFPSGQGSEILYPENDFPDEAKQLYYEMTQFYCYQYAYYLGLDLMIQLKILNRYPEAEAFSRNSCRRCDWMLFKTGSPEKCFTCRTQKP